MQPAAKTTSTGKGPAVQRRGKGQVYSGGRTAKAEQRGGETLQKVESLGGRLKDVSSKAPDACKEQSVLCTRRTPPIS